MTPLGNVTLDQPFVFVRGSGGFSLIFQLRNGPQPILPTDPIYPPTDLSPAGTFVLFMVKKYDADPSTGVPVPDSAAILTKDSRLSTPNNVIIRNPPTAGLVEVPIWWADTSQVDTYGNPLMPNGVPMRWSIKAFLSNGTTIVGEHTPLAGPWTIVDRSVQKVLFP